MRCKSKVPKEKQSYKWNERFPKLYHNAVRKASRKKTLTAVEGQYIYIGMSKELMDLNKSLVAKQQIIDGLLRNIKYLERRIAV